MKYLYFNENGCSYHDPESKTPVTAIISVIIVDDGARRNLRKLINEICMTNYGEDRKLEVLKWSEVTAQNLTPYLQLMNLFERTESLHFFSVIIPDFQFYKKYPVYQYMIQEIYNKYNQEDLRVFLPQRKNTKKLKELQDALEEIGIVCPVNQTTIEESRFYQMANVGGGLLRYTLSDNFTENSIGKGIYPLIQSVLDMKKDQDKMMIEYYQQSIPDFSDFNHPVISLESLYEFDDECSSENDDETENISEQSSVITETSSSAI